MAGLQSNSNSMSRICRTTTRACSASRSAAGVGTRCLPERDEQIRVQFVGQAAQLHADGARRNVELFRRFCDAAAVDDGEKQFQLPDFHFSTDRALKPSIAQDVISLLIHAMISRREFALTLAAPPLALHAPDRKPCRRASKSIPTAGSAISIRRSTAISPSIWAAASKAACSKKARRFPIRTAIAKT